MESGEGKERREKHMRILWVKDGKLKQYRLSVIDHKLKPSAQNIQVAKFQV